MLDMPKDMFTQVSAIVSPVYLVGGSVRDIILGKEPKDYDFTTPLTPDEVEAKVKAAGRRVYAIGKKFGTIGFKVHDGKRYQYVEITTFRREQYSQDNRKPEVQFVTDLNEDLSRRDFTINAIAFDGEKYIDPYGGRLDIMAKKIKGVGEVRDRFKEDPLRMLRAARFAAQLGFEVDPNMIGKIRAMADKITTVSRERWVQELDKLLVAQYTDYGFGVLLDGYLLRFMLPEVWRLCSLDPRYEAEIYHNLHAAPNDPDSKWAALLLTIGKPFVATSKNENMFFPKHEIVGHEMAVGICSRLKFSNDRTELVLESIKKQGRNLLTA